MDIYVVSEVDPDRESQNIGVFSSQEKADEFIEERKGRVKQLFPGFTFHQYTEIFELDSWDEDD